MHRQLIQRIRQGDRDAMARLIELDQASLFRFMMRRLGNSEDAADATQEAVRRVLASLATLRNPAAYRGWLYRIAINVAQDLVRTRQSERHLALVMKHSSSPSKATDMAGREDEELREKVRAAVSDLEDELRTTVVLRYEQGLSYEEIAGAMQTPAGTVAKRLHTAHQRLQQVLAGAGASGVLGSISQALAAPAMDSIPTGLAEALKRVALDSPLPPSALPFSLGTKGVAVLIALGFLGLGSGLVYWRNRVPPTLETLSSRRPGPKIGDGRFSASGGQTPARSFAPGESVPASASTASEALAVLKGFVRDQETRLPLPGAQVWLTSPHQSPSPRYSAVAGSDGSFSLEAPAGLYSMDALAPGYVRYGFEKIIEIHRFGLAKEKAQADQAGSLMEVQLETGLPRTRLIDLLPGGEIRGQVLDSRGNPVSGATVDLEMQDFKWVSGSQENQLSISYEPDGEVNTYVTDFRGAFRIAHLYPEGAGALRVTHLGFAPLRRTLVLSRTALETRLVLQDGKTLGGKVLNARGEAVENACLLLGVSGSNRLTASPTGSSPSGTYLLADLLPETCSMAAYAPGYAPALVRVEGKDPSQIALVLPEADRQVSGVILDELGQPLEGVSASVHHYDITEGNERARMVFVDERGGGSSTDEDGRPSGFLPRSCRPPQSLSQEDGRFELDKIALTSTVIAGLQFEKTGYVAIERTVADTGFVEIRMQRKAQK